MLRVGEGCFHRFTLDEGNSAAMVVLTTTVAGHQTSKAQTPAASAAWCKANGGEEHPSRARYRYLFLRPKPRFPLSMLEPTEGEAPLPARHLLRCAARFSSCTVGSRCAAARALLRGCAYFALLHADINYNYVVVEQLAMCAIGVLLCVLAVLPASEEEMAGYWMIMCPFPFMLCVSLPRN